MDKDSHPDTELFIQEWLNHFSIRYQSKVQVSSKSTLDFYIEDWALGILINDWKRPISVQIVNKAVTIARKMKTKNLYLVAKEISEPAKKTLSRYGDQVVAIHPNGLSELALKFSQLGQDRSPLSSFAQS
jgi:hypothetical protein